MLDAEEFKKLLPPDHNLDDEQIEKLRHQMHQLAEVIIDAALWDARKKREAAEAAAGDGSEPERPPSARRYRRSRTSNPLPARSRQLFPEVDKEDLGL